MALWALLGTHCMNKSSVVAAALIAWSSAVTATLNAGNVSWGVSVGSWGGGIGV
ncbi:MAG: hypothetical protein RIS24_2886, partial [Verrucomicrobiota bacterium]